MTTNKKQDAIPQKRRPAATTPEARENQLVGLAVDLVEKQLREGTASSQVITQVLKRASIKEKIEMEILIEQKKLIMAKTKAMESTERIEELYSKAVEAMRDYSGSGGKDND